MVLVITGKYHWVLNLKFKNKPLFKGRRLSAWVEGSCSTPSECVYLEGDVIKMALATELDKPLVVGEKLFLGVKPSILGEVTIQNISYESL